MLNAQGRNADHRDGQSASISVADYRRVEAQILKAAEKGEVFKKDAETRLVEMFKFAFQFISVNSPTARERLGK